MKVEFTNTAEDLQVLVRYARQWWHPWLFPACLVLASLPGAVLSACRGLELWAVGGLGVAVVGSLGSLWLIRRARAAIKASGVQVTLTVTPEALHESTLRGESWIWWSSIEDIAEVEDRLLIGICQEYWIIPSASFASRSDFETFQQAVRARIRDATPRGQRELQPPPGPLPADEVEVEVCFHNTRRDVLVATERARGRKVKNSIVAALAIAYLAAVGLFCQVLLPGLAVVIGQFVLTLACFSATVQVADWILWRAQRLHLVVALPRRLQLSQKGIGHTSYQFERILPWDVLDGVDRDDNYNYLFFSRSPFSGFVIPRSAFSSNDAFEWFYYFAAECHAKTQDRKKLADPANLPPRAPLPRVTVETGNPYQPPRSGETSEGESVPP